VPPDMLVTYVRVKKENGVWVADELRTLENLLEDNEMWTHSSGDRSALKNYCNKFTHPKNICLDHL